jgi:hypothetical protein
VRVLSARLSNLIDAASILKKPIDPRLLYRAQRSIVMWHEHTWGAWNSISDPDDPEVIAQWKYKKAFADSAGWYIDAISGSLFPIQRSSDTLLVVNSLGWRREGAVTYPDSLGRDFYRCGPDSLETWNWLDLLRHSDKAVDVAAEGTTCYSSILSEAMTRSREKAVTHARKHHGGSIQGKVHSAPYFIGTWPLLFGQCAKWDGLDNPVGLWFNIKNPEFFRKQLMGSYGATVHRSIPGIDSMKVTVSTEYDVAKVEYTIHPGLVRSKESLHFPLPFNIPNATVRIGISDTCVTPESGRIPGSNNDFFCAQRWIDVSNDSMGVTIVCPQGALWEVGEMVDERKQDHGHKRWKSEAHSSSTIYLYALNNYWHTNFKADQEGPVTFDIYLKLHGPFKLEDARRFGLEMTRPLITWWK